MADKDWLDSLKVGDKVAIRRSGFGQGEYIITTVEKITKTGQIKVSGMENKFKDGREMGIGGSWDIPDYIVPITDEVRDSMLRYKLISELGKVKYANLSTEKLRKIKAILEE